MKKYSIFFSLLLALLFAACKKDENKVTFEGGTAPVLTASSNTINLAFANADNQAVKLSWTNPEYRFNTGVSSQDVNYVVEIDLAGANFNSANKQSVAVSRDLTVAFTIAQFNDYLLNQLLLVPGQQRDVEVRVKASIGSTDAGTLYSNKLSYTVTPYAIPPKVTPPSSGKLFITGGATPASWMSGGDAELASQRFTQVSATLYELASIELTGDGSFLFVPVYGDWSHKYGGVGANNSNNVNGDDFKAEGGDLKAPAATGKYKVVVDFQRGKYTLTKL
ncbi:MAG: SusE domain-containing protein [Sphingobacteriales bacterium]|nr:SusE domain-containing protein [Sphingobacteriales bacterium]OJW31971.1 MAG: hypothetical protein BGO54_16195 [Sphingobacteriales bacterium 46-32]